MKGILEFNLPDEQPEFDMACNASKYVYVIGQIREELRNCWKYNENEPRTIRNYAEKIYQRIADLLIEEGIADAE